MSNENGWAVSIEAALLAPITATQIDDLVDLLGETVSIDITADGARLFTTVSVYQDSASPTLPNALVTAANHFIELVQKVDGAVRDIVSVTAMTFAEQDARLAEPAFPVLAGVAELAERLGVSKQRIVTLSKSRGFPAPVANLHSGPVWRLEDVARFESTWTRRSGRPRVDVLPVEEDRRHVVEVRS